MWAPSMLSPFTRREKTSPSPARNGSKSSSSPASSIASRGLPAGPRPRTRLPEELDPAGGFPVAADVPLALQQLHVVEGVFFGDPETGRHLPRGGGEGAGAGELPEELEDAALLVGQRSVHIGM